MTNDKVALITGSTSGIGKAIATKLHQDGLTIIYHSRTSVEQGQILAKTTPNASYYQADLSQTEQIHHLIEAIKNDYGRLDVIVNNAGINALIPHHDLPQASPDLWRQLYEVNVIAPWTIVSEAESLLNQSSTMEEPSCIINITSHAGVRPKGGSIPYAVSKAALNHLTKLLAVTLAPKIRVNAIAPGLVNTPMTEGWTEAEKLWQEKSPMKRKAEPKDIAQIASMLVKNNYLTGEVILADGGLNLT